MFSLQTLQKTTTFKKRTTTSVKRKNIKIQICQASLNPYKTLGVQADAEDSDIKKAYKKLVLKYHPDVSQETNADARFKEIQRAYEILMGKDSDSWSMEGDGQQRKGWDFHDWYWSFSMKQRRAKKSGYVEPQVDLQTEEKKTQVRSQLAGLKQRAAQRRQQQPVQPQVQSAIRENQAQASKQQVNQSVQSHNMNNSTQKTHKPQKHNTQVYYWNIQDWQSDKSEFEFRQNNRNIRRYLGVLGVMITTSFQSFPNPRISDIKGHIIDTRNTMCAEHKQLANSLISNHFKLYFDAFALYFSGCGDMSMEEEFNYVVNERLNSSQTQHAHNVCNNNEDLQYSYYTSNLQNSEGSHRINNNLNSAYNNYQQENVQNEKYTRQSSSSFREDGNQLRSQLAGLKRKSSFRQNEM